MMNIGYMGVKSWKSIWLGNCKCVSVEYYVLNIMHFFLIIFWNSSMWFPKSFHYKVSTGYFLPLPQVTNLFNRPTQLQWRSVARDQRTIFCSNLQEKLQYIFFELEEKLQLTVLLYAQNIPYEAESRAGLDGVDAWDHSIPVKIWR
jgi:hypothetical protein